MEAEEIAPGVLHLPSRPRHAFNAYLADGVLIDAGTRWAHRRLRRAIGTRRVDAHVLTHAHADHQGSTARLCTDLGIPLWVGAEDVPFAEAGNVLDNTRTNPVTRWQSRFWAGPGHPVARELREGDAVGSFVVLETPGHARGHISLWRAEDGTLIAGDVLFGQHPVTGRPGAHEPPRIFTPDVALNRRAIRRLAELRPRLTVCGHGPPLHDPGPLEELAAAVS